MLLLLLVYVDSLRTMHINACTALGLPDSTVRELQELLGELEKLLEGIIDIDTKQQNKKIKFD